MVARDDLQVVQLVSIHSAGAERANLALAHQIIERFHGLFHGNVVIEAVNDVKVQVIGAQALERAFDLAFDGVGGKAAFVEVNLASQHDALASDSQIAQGVANVLFARAKAVAVRGIDKVDSGVECAFDDGACVVGSDGPLMKVGAGLAKAHASQAEFRDFNAGMAKGCVLHGVLLIFEGMAIAYVDRLIMYIAHID